MKIKIFIFIMLMFTLVLTGQAAPVKTGGTNPAYEITVENLDSGGSPVNGYTNGDFSLTGVLAEPGGITKLTGGVYTLYSGYLGQDLIAPESISLNASLDSQTGTVNLSWSAPGDDHDAEQLEKNTRFFIATTTVLNNAQSEGYWYSRRNSNSCDFTISTGPINPGDNSSHLIADLAEGVTYYFRIWTLDQACNWSEISSGATIQFLWAPGPITDLKAYQGLYGRSVKLVWTAPGDDGYSGTLSAGSKYAIQRSTWTDVVYSTTSIDAVYVSTASVNPGDYQSYNLTSLQQGVTYYVRMWTADEWPSWSSISNSSSTWATYAVLSITMDTTWYYFGTLDTGVSTDTNKAVKITNSGNVYETYSFSATNSQDLNLGTAQASDTFVLRSAFHASRPSALGDFDVNSNILGLGSVLGTDSIFTIDGSQTGVGIDPFPFVTSDADRNLWFKLSAPLAVSTTNYQDIYITITGEESYYP